MAVPLVRGDALERAEVAARDGQLQLQLPAFQDTARRTFGALAHSVGASLRVHRRNCLNQCADWVASVFHSVLSQAFNSVTLAEYFRQWSDGSPGPGSAGRNDSRAT